MVPVTFPCEHCGKLIGVSPKYLGKPVRCPHCKQVLAAPASAPAAEVPAAQTGAPEPLFVSPALAESIFESTEDATGDALFEGPSKPLVEMPSEILVPEIKVETTPPQGTPFNAEDSLAPLGKEPSAPASREKAAEPTPESEPPSPPEGELDFTDAALKHAPATSPTDGSDKPAEIGPGEDSLAALAAAAKKPRRARGGILVPTLLIFLIPYSIVSTAAVVLLYWKKQEPSLEVLPDPRPDKETGGPARRSDQRVRPDINVPAHLVTRLEEPLRVGDLEAVPRRIERVAGNRLRLSLTLRNVSQDVEFNPVSNAFLEHDRDVPAAAKPYTFLEVLGTSGRIYGGRWRTQGHNGKSSGRLEPGQEMEAELTTDPLDGPKVRALQGAAGPLLWRLQVRRGFIRYQGKDVSATAVIAVQFHSADIT